MERSLLERLQRKKVPKLQRKEWHLVLEAGVATILSARNVVGDYVERLHYVQVAWNEEQEDYLVLGIFYVFILKLV